MHYSIEVGRVVLFRVSGRVGFSFFGFGSGRVFTRSKKFARVGSGTRLCYRVLGNLRVLTFWNFIRNCKSSLEDIFQLWKCLLLFPCTVVLWFMLKSSWNSGFLRYFLAKIQNYIIFGYPRVLLSGSGRVGFYPKAKNGPRVGSGLALFGSGFSGFGYPTNP